MKFIHRGIPSGQRHRGRKVWAVGGSLAIASLAIPVAAQATTARNAPSGAIKVAVNAFPTGLTPVIAPIIQENSSYAMEGIYGLLGYEDAKTGAVHLQFLQSMTPSKDFKTWTLTLKSGIKFSDGTPLNAAAIEYTLKQLINPKNAYQYQKQMVGWKMNVASTDALQVTLPSTDAQFPGEMTQEFPFIASPTAWAKEGAKFATKPVGAGAFVLKSFVANSSLTMVANPNYYIPTEPHVSEVVLNNFPTSQTQMVNALTTGQDNLAWLQGAQQVTEAKAAGMSAQPYPQSGGLWLTMNTQAKPFNNPLARQAIQLALDHQGLASAWAPGSTAMKEVFASTSPFYNSKYVNPKENDAQAQADFNKLAAEGDPVDFTITDLAGYEGIAEFVQSHLASYKNVKVKISIVQVGPYISDSVNDTFQMVPQGATYAAPWPDLAQAIEQGGPVNYGRWNDPKVNAAIKAIESTTSTSVEKAQWNIVLQEIQSQVPFFTAQGAVLTNVWKGISGFTNIEQGTLPLMEQLTVK